MAIKTKKKTGRPVKLSYDVRGIVEADAIILDPKISPQQLEKLLNSEKAQIAEKQIVMRRSGRVIGEIIFSDDVAVEPESFYVDEEED